MKHEVQAIAHKDVKGKEQLYLKIGNETDNVVINIGKKTFDAVNNLTEKDKKLSDEQTPAQAGQRPKVQK